MSVNKSEKRAPATITSQMGLLLQYHRQMPWASAKAAHCPADRRRSAMSKPTGMVAWKNRNHASGTSQAIRKRPVSSNNAPHRKIEIAILRRRAIIDDQRNLPYFTA